MNELIDMVTEFHMTKGLAVGEISKPDLSVRPALRLALIQEEVDELTLAMAGNKAVKQPDGSVKIEPFTSERERQIAVADALGDIAYVVAGAAVQWGIPLGAVCEEIHRSNMTKSPSEKRDDGKVMKGPDYSPPDLEKAWQEAIEFEAFCSGSEYIQQALSPLPDQDPGDEDNT